MSRFEREFSMNEQSTTKKYIALRMERQHLLTPANEIEYDALYRKPLKKRDDDASLLSRKEEIIATVQP